MDEQKDLGEIVERAAENTDEEFKVGWVYPTGDAEDFKQVYLVLFSLSRSPSLKKPLLCFRVQEEFYSKYIRYEEYYGELGYDNLEYFTADGYDDENNPKLDYSLVLSSGLPYEEWRKLQGFQTDEAIEKVSPEDIANQQNLDTKNDKIDDLLFKYSSMMHEKEDTLTAKDFQQILREKRGIMYSEEDWKIIDRLTEMKNMISNRDKELSLLNHELFLLKKKCERLMLDHEKLNTDFLELMATPPFDLLSRARSSDRREDDNYDRIQNI